MNINITKLPENIEDKMSMNQLDLIESFLEMKISNEEKTQKIENIIRAILKRKKLKEEDIHSLFNNKNISRRKFLEYIKESVELFKSRYYRQQTIESQRPKLTCVGKLDLKNGNREIIKVKQTSRRSTMDILNGKDKISHTQAKEIQSLLIQNKDDLEIVEDLKNWFRKIRWVKTAHTNTFFIFIGVDKEELSTNRDVKKIQETIDKRLSEENEWMYIDRKNVVVSEKWITVLDDILHTNISQEEQKELIEKRYLSINGRESFNIREFYNTIGYTGNSDLSLSLIKNIISFLKSWMGEEETEDVTEETDKKQVNKKEIRQNQTVNELDYVGKYYTIEEYLRRFGRSSVDLKEWIVVVGRYLNSRKMPSVGGGAEETLEQPKIHFFTIWNEIKKGNSVLISVGILHEKEFQIPKEDNGKMPLYAIKIDSLKADLSAERNNKKQSYRIWGTLLKDSPKNQEEKNNVLEETLITELKKKFDK